MAYYRRRNFSSGYRRSSYASAYVQPDAPSESGAISEIYTAVRQIMFELPYHQQESLFRRYGEKFGSSAESYARKVFPSWKSGSVGMSGQTATRMTQLVPHFFTRTQKFECIKALTRRSIGKRHKSVHVTVSDWRDKVRGVRPWFHVKARNSRFSRIKVSKTVCTLENRGQPDPWPVFPKMLFPAPAAAC